VGNINNWLDFVEENWRAITLFTLIYAFSFNAFNVIYYSEVIVLNGLSAIINAAAIVSMFTIIFQNKFK
jgi:hypothetical protein